MFGIIVEIGVAIWSANDAWQTRQIAAENSQLKAPVSDVSAILRLDLGSTNIFDINPATLWHTDLTLADSITSPNVYFTLGAKLGGRSDHVDNPMSMNRHVIFYGIDLRFEQSQMPLPELNNINMTNDFLPPSITVTDAISKITVLQAYIDFIPKNTPIIKGRVRVFINGFPKDFQISSNSVSKEFSEWNPDRPGIFLLATNSVP
jgi:hypothetical protein